MKKNVVVNDLYLHIIEHVDVDTMFRPICSSGIAPDEGRRMDRPNRRVNNTKPKERDQMSAKYNSSQCYTFLFLFSNKKPSDNNFIRIELVYQKTETNDSLGFIKMFV